MFTEPFFQDSEISNSGWVEVVSGPMFSGKTEELMRRLRRAKIAQQKIELFKPSLDKRYHEKKVVSHDESEMESIVIENENDILKLSKDAQVIAIDEAQFFSNEIIDIIKTIADKGKRVIVAGLDKDYMGKPFGPMPQLMANAEFITKLHAICVRCGSLASFSYRIKKSKKTVMLGATEEYQARCRACFNLDE
ncbi:MAG: thymidine kinase [Cytophagales bacterium]